MFTIELLPAAEGDCIWVEWGDPAAPHRMLIDASHGRGADRLPLALETKIEALGEGDRFFELVVATHIDVDHVHGLVPLFVSPPRGFHANQVWFNARRHLPSDALGYKDGNRLTVGLARNVRRRWNAGWPAQTRRAVVVPDASGALPVRHIGGMELVLLSPDRDSLRGLLAKWPDVVKEADLGRRPATTDGDLLGGPRDVGTPLRELAGMTEDKADPSPSNRTSIAFLATYEGRTVLFGADAHADVLTSALGRVNGGKPVHVDICKVPHHGSRQNVKPEFLRLLDCDTWLVSTNGNKHHHPDRRAMARILARRGQTLVFNYQCPTTAEFGKFTVKREFDSKAFYSASKDGGVRVDVVTKTVIT